MTAFDELVSWLGERSWANERALERWGKSQRPLMFRIEALNLIGRAVRARLVVETSVRVAGEPQRRWHLSGRPPAPALSPEADEELALEEPPGPRLEAPDTATSSPPAAVPEAEPPRLEAPPEPPTNEARVLAALSADTWRTRAEVAQLAGLEEGTVGWVLMRLLDAGRCRWAKARWALPP